MKNKTIRITVAALLSFAGVFSVACGMGVSDAIVVDTEQTTNQLQSETSQTPVNTPKETPETTENGLMDS